MNIKDLLTFEEWKEIDSQILHAGMCEVQINRYNYQISEENKYIIKIDAKHSEDGGWKHPINVSTLLLEKCLEITKVLKLESEEVIFYVFSEHYDKEMNDDDYPCHMKIYIKDGWLKFSDNPNISWTSLKEEE